MSTAAEIRSLRDDERPALGALFANAYRLAPAVGLGWAEATVLEHTLAVVEEGGRVASSITVIPFEVLLGGRAQAMGGVAGVATWMDRQGKGGASRLMREGIRRMRERDQAVSYLWPFSHAFYRRLGYESVGTRIRYTEIKPSQVRALEERGLVRLAESEADFAAMRALLAAQGERYNGVVARAEDRWKRRLTSLRDDQRGYAYVVDRAGEVLGYFLAEHSNITPSSFELTVREFVASEPVALRAMMGFLASMPPNIGKLTFVAPAAPSLLPYFIEPFVQADWLSASMARIVDLGVAVARRGYPAGAQVDVVIELQDNAAPWNAGPWRLEVSGGEGRATRVGGGDAPALTLTIQQLSALFVGGLDPVSAAREEQFPHAPAETLESLRGAFFDRPVWMTEGF